MCDSAEPESSRSPEVLRAALMFNNIGMALLALFVPVMAVVGVDFSVVIASGALVLFGWWFWRREAFKRFGPGTGT